MKPSWGWEGGVWGFRSMLNPPGHHSTAAIVAELSKRSYGWETTLQISDCQRVVSMSFYGPEAEHQFDHEADLYKIDTMIHGLREFRKALVRERKKISGK